MADQAVGWVKLYHPSGVLVSIPFDPQKEPDPVLAKNALGQINLYLEAGFTANAGDLEDGEQKFDALYVVRREMEEKGRLVQVLDLYTADEGQNKFKFLKVYLDTDEEIEEFNRVSGMVLDRLEKYIGTGDIERGKQRNLDRLVYKAPRPFQVVYKKNPKYDDAAAKNAKPGEYMVAKKRFVRWGATSSQAMPTGQTRPVSPPPASASPEDRTRQAMVKWWENYLTKDPSLAELTDNWNRFVAHMPAETIKAVEDGPIERHRAMTGIWYDTEGRAWCPPKPVQEDGDHIPF